MIRFRNHLRSLFAVTLCLLLPACGQAEPSMAKQASAEVEKAVPIIAASEKEFDFGQIGQGVPVEHTFEIFNRGDAELILGEIRSSCTCLTAIAAATRIAAGRKVQIKTKLNTTDQSGKVHKKIYITSNDPETRTLSLSFEGEVVPDLEVVPRSLRLGEINKGERVVRDFSITIREPQMVKIKSVTAEDKRLKISRKSESTDKIVRYELQFEAGKQIGLVSTQLVVSYEGSHVPTLNIPVQGDVMGDLRYSKMIHFFNSAGHFSPFELAISSRSNKPFKIKKAEDPSGKLKLTIVQPNGPNGRIRAEVSKPKISGSQNNRFFVYTDDKNEPKLEIVYIMYPGPAPGQTTGLRPHGAPPTQPMAPK
jgi:hypothetical protein